MTYINFFCSAYMNASISSVNYDSLEDLFNIVIIPDLINYRDYANDLPALAEKEAYKTMSYRKSNQKTRGLSCGSTFMVR